MENLNTKIEGFYTLAQSLGIRDRSISSNSIKTLILNDQNSYRRLGEYARDVLMELFPQAVEPVLNPSWLSPRVQTDMEFRKSKFVPRRENGVNYSLNGDTCGIIGVPGACLYPMGGGSNQYGWSEQVVANSNIVGIRLKVFYQDTIGDFERSMREINGVLLTLEGPEGKIEYIGGDGRVH